MDFVGKLYVLSGLCNTVGLSVFNRLYYGAPSIAALAPSVFSIESQVLINTWGLAYIATAKNWKNMPLLSSVFCVEKLLYVYWWYELVLQNTTRRHEAISMVTSGSDVLTGSFFLFFGLNDLVFALVFGYGAFKGFQSSQKAPKTL